MDPATIGARLASAAISPLVKKLFVSEGPGAGLVDKPIRISGYVSFKGEKRALTESDVRDLAAKLVKQALRSGERPIPADEEQAVTDTLADTLHALGDLTITDLDAVRLGSEAFAAELRRASDHPERQLSADATYFYESLLNSACLHILHFFTQRSTFVAHALVEQTREVAGLIAKVDELIRRTPLPGGEDAAFEQAAYLPYVAKKHGKLTIYGIDLSNSPARWPLDVAYLSLEATGSRSSVQEALRWYGLADESIRRDATLRNMALASDPSSPLKVIDRGSITMAGGGDLDATPATLLMVQKAESLLARALAEGMEVSSADQVLADRHRVLLRGEAGSGKTTLVQWLAVTTTVRQDLSNEMSYLYDRIPFVLPLRTLTRNGQQLPAPKDFLAAVRCPLDGTQPAGWENRVLAAGRGLILIDGIDEIPDAERERTRRWLQDLIETYDGDNRWLVTSRPSAVGQDWLAEDGFAELTLSAMGPADVATFIRRWHKAARAGAEDLGEIDAFEQQLLAAVRSKADLGRLATNPLMCGLICALHRDRRGYLPHGRKDLYEAALSMLLSRRDRERDMVGPDLREEPQLDLLQRLAYWLIKNGRTEMDRSRAVEIIGRALPAVPEAAALGEAPAVFEHFLHRSGLLREPGPDTVDFIHRSFQDFLGARAAVDEGDFGLLVDHAADDQWEDVIRMAVAVARPRERVEILSGLVALGDRTAEKRTQARIYLLAAACLEHATALDPSVRGAVEGRMATLIPPTDENEALALAKVGPLILDLLPGPEGAADFWTTYYVVTAASHVKSDAAISFLAQFAEHPFQLIRSALQLAWSRFDCTEYADGVIARLDPNNLTHVIKSDDQLHHLSRIGLRPRRMRIEGGISPEALRSYASQNTFSALSLLDNATSDLAFLSGQRGLTSLTITDCPALADISAIDKLPSGTCASAMPHPTST